MATEGIVPTHMLQQVPLFQYLSPDELQKIGILVKQRSFRKKAVIFTEGSEKKAVYVVQSGLVKTYRTDKRGCEQIESFLKKDDLFPQTGVFDGIDYPVTAECIVQTTLLTIPVEGLERVMQQHPVISVKIMRAINEQRSEPRTYEKLSGQSPQRRGQMFLLKLVEHYGTSVKGELRIGIPMTQDDLAHTIGSTKDKLSLFLDQLRNAGIADMHRSGFVIHDVESLKRWKEI